MNYINKKNLSSFTYFDRVKFFFVLVLQHLPWHQSGRSSSCYGVWVTDHGLGSSRQYTPESRCITIFHFEMWRTDSNSIIINFQRIEKTRDRKQTRSPLKMWIILPKSKKITVTDDFICSHWILEVGLRMARQKSSGSKCPGEMPKIYSPVLSRFAIINNPPTTTLFSKQNSLKIFIFDWKLVIFWRKKLFHRVILF